MQVLTLTLSGHATMTTFMRQLRALAELFSLTIIVSTSSSRRFLSSPWTWTYGNAGHQLVDESRTEESQTPEPGCSL